MWVPNLVILWDNLAFGGDTLFLGFGVERVDDKFWVDHMRVFNEGHKGLSKLLEGFLTF